MKKISKSSWLKIALAGSLVLNIIFLVGFIALNSLSDISRIRAFQQHYCGEKYEAMLRSVAEGQDEEHARQAQLVYAMTVCLKNYKTGEPLDLDPLVKQVEATP